MIYLVVGFDQRLRISGMIFQEFLDELQRKNQIARPTRFVVTHFVFISFQRFFRQTFFIGVEIIDERIQSFDQTCIGQWRSLKMGNRTSVLIVRRAMVPAWSCVRFHSAADRSEGARSIPII